MVLRINVLIFFYVQLIGLSFSQSKGYSFTIWDLKGEQVLDADVSVWKKHNDSQMTALACEIKMNGGTYNVICPCTVQSVCDSTSVLKVVHPMYETTIVPLFMLDPGEKILIGEVGSKHYLWVRYSLNNTKGIYKVPYVTDSLLVRIKLTNYGLKNIDKVTELLGSNGMELAEKIDSSNVRKECGISVKKKNNQPFSKNSCNELKKLRENKKLILFAGPSINNSQNAFTNYLVVKTKAEDKKSIMKFLLESGFKITNSTGTDDRNGDGKKDFYVFVVEANKDIGEDVDSTAKFLLEKKEVLQCDIVLFCNNRSLGLYPPGYYGKFKPMTRKEKKYWEKIKTKPI